VKNTAQFIDIKFRKPKGCWTFWLSNSLE